jgi:hypothetical protein
MSSAILYEVGWSCCANWLRCWTSDSPSSPETFCCNYYSGVSTVVSKRAKSYVVQPHFLVFCSFSIESSVEMNPRIGIRRFESFCQFCGRARRFESPSQGFESLLPSKKYLKLLTIVQIWVTFSKHLQICNLFLGIFELSLDFF